MDKQKFKKYMLDSGRSASTCSNYINALKQAGEILNISIFDASEEKLQYFIKEFASGGKHTAIGDINHGAAKAGVKRYYEAMLVNKPAEVVVDIVEPIETVQEESSEELEPGFRDLLTQYYKAVSKYSGYNFSSPVEIMDHYNYSDDPIFGDKYYMLISIREARNCWAHPDKDEQDNEDLIEIGRRYIKMVLRKLNQKLC